MFRFLVVMGSFFDFVFKGVWDIVDYIDKYVDFVGDLVYIFGEWWEYFDFCLYVVVVESVFIVFVVF